MKLLILVMLIIASYFAYHWYTAPPALCAWTEERCQLAAGRHSELSPEMVDKMCAPIVNQCIAKCEQQPEFCDQQYEKVKNDTSVPDLVTSTDQQDPCQDILKKCQADVQAGKLPATKDGQDTCVGMAATCRKSM